MEKEILSQNKCPKNRCDICKFLDVKFIDCECELKACFPCIQKFLSYSFFKNISLNTNFFEKSPNLPFFCFSCKRERFITIKEINNISKENKQKILPILCDYCGEKEIIFVCMDCASRNGNVIKICKDCLNTTHKKKLKDHNFIEFNPTILCLCKENNVCTKLCQDCSMIICQECIVKNHKNHILQSIDDIFNEIINRKKEEIASLIENLKNEIFNKSYYESGILQEERQIDMIIGKLESHLILLQAAITKIKEKKTHLSEIRSFYQHLKDNLNISIFENFPIQLKYFLSQKMDFSKLDLDFQNMEFMPNERKLKQILEEAKELSRSINTLVKSISDLEIKTFKLGVKSNEKEIAGISPNEKNERLKIESINNQKTKGLIFGADGEDKKKCSYLEIHRFSTIGVKVNEKEYDFFKKFTEISPNLTIERPLQFKFNQEKVLCVLDIEDMNNQKSKCLIFGVNGEDNKKYLEIHKFSTIKKKKKKREIKIEKMESIESHFENLRLIDKFENFLYTCAEDIHVYPAINDLNNLNKKKRRVFKHPKIDEFIRSFHMFRDRTMELFEDVKKDEKIYVLFSLENNSSVFLINYKNRKLCKEFIMNEGKLCTALDSFYDENQRKLYLILGYQLSYIQVFEFNSSSSFNCVARYSSENFCLNSIKLESCQGIFYLYFGFGNGSKKIGKISKYEFKKQLENENQYPITQFEIKENQIFATEIINDNFVAATQEYLYLFNKNHFEEGFTKSCKFKDAKISDVVYIKDKDLGELLATISFQEKAVKIYKL